MLHVVNPVGTDHSGGHDGTTPSTSIPSGNRSNQPRDTSKLPYADLEELVGSNPTQRNWRGILIALIVILLVCSLIVLAIILVTPMEHDGKELGESFTFAEMFSKDYFTRDYKALWIGEKNVYVYMSKDSDQLLEYNADLNTTTLIMDNSTFRKLNTDTYFVSEDLKYVLLAYDQEHVYRHTTNSRYKIYNRESRDVETRLTKFPQSVTNEWDDAKLQYAGWSPKGHKLTFVYNNNLYYQSSPDNTATQVTENGRPRLIFNGIPDWMYEEEILHSNKAHWFSPEGNYIIYASINDTSVPTYRYPHYGPGTDIYGEVEEMAYPKAGDLKPNIIPTVRLFVVPTNNLQMAKEIHPPTQLRKQEFYVTMVEWRDDLHVLIAWSNRVQNYTIITMCNVISTDCTVNLQESSHEDKGWVFIDKVKVINKGQQYLAVLPEQDGVTGYWKHIVMVTTVTTKLGAQGAKTQLTQGQWEVIELLAYDQQDKYMYYIGTNLDPKKRHLFRVGPAYNKGPILVPECLTCDLDEDCQYVTATFSHTAKYYVLGCLGPGVPYYSLRNTLNDKVVMLEDNAELKLHLEKKALPRKEFFEFKTKDGETLWGQMYIPPTLKKEHITQYPLLVHTYGGPGMHMVSEQFALGWRTYLSSRENVIYASIDGRGTVGRGDRFLYKNYRNLGTYDVQDQIEGAEYLRKNYKYVDKERIAIWGWSYGGFVTTHALGDTSDVFQCGIAVAPVTDWRYYDAAYTERYMGFASDNYRGYDNANASRKVMNYGERPFLLIHGTADDNVHFQNSAQFLKSLTQVNANYQIQIYTDQRHALDGRYTTEHLYLTMTKFLKKQCWEGGAPRDVQPAQKPVESGKPINKS